MSRGGIVFASGGDNKSLNAYATGSFIPTLGGAQSNGSSFVAASGGTSIVSGHYIRIGDLITASVVSDSLGLTTPANNIAVRLTGLPVSSPTGSTHTGSVTVENIAVRKGKAEAIGTTMSIPPGTNVAVLSFNMDDAVIYSPPTQAAYKLNFTITYIV